MNQELEASQRGRANREFGELPRLIGNSEGVPIRD